MPLEMKKRGNSVTGGRDNMIELKFRSDSTAIGLQIWQMHRNSSGGSNAEVIASAQRVEILTNKSIVEANLDAKFIKRFTSNGNISTH